MFENKADFRWPLILGALLFLFIAASGCRQQPDSPTPEPTQVQSKTNLPTISPEVAPEPTGAPAGYPYPPPPLPDKPVEYPLPDLPTPLTSYPAATEQPAGTVLAFDRPLQAGDTSISGVGPPGLTVTIRNITFMNEEIAATTIDENGHFEVAVEPVQAGIRIGLTTDVEASGVTETILPAEGAINVPQVGYFYDSIVIPSTR